MNTAYNSTTTATDVTTTQTQQPEPVATEYYGYLDGRDPMQIGRIKKQLDRRIYADGKICTWAEYIAEGYEAGQLKAYKDEYTYAKKGRDLAYHEHKVTEWVIWTVREMERGNGVVANKTIVDYARYLIKLMEATPATAPQATEEDTATAPEEVTTAPEATAETPEKSEEEPAPATEATDDPEDMATQSRLFKIILEENYDSFLEIISKEDISLETINKILDLDKKKLKRIDIDDKKLKISRKELDNTVDIVTDFVGDDLLLEEDEKALSKEEIVDKQAYRLDENAKKEEDKGLKDCTHKFLKDLLARGEIPEAEVKSIALSNSKMLNSFLKDMNDQLYDYTADQTLINEDGYIRIDPFYEEMVKEIVDGKYKS